MLRLLWEGGKYVAKRLAAKKAQKEAKERLVRGLRRQVEAHKKKLDDFKRDPDAHDNRDFLKNAPSQETRERIIEGRIRNLERQIENFQKQIDDILGSGGSP